MNTASDPVVLEAVECDAISHLLRVRIKSPEIYCTVHALLPSTDTPSHWTLPYFEIIRCWGISHTGISVRQAIDLLEACVGASANLPDWVITSSPRQH